MLGSRAWRLVEVADRIDSLTLTADVGGRRIQHGTLGELLTPVYWLEELRKLELAEPGTVLLSGTIPMDTSVDQFADSWRVDLGDPATGDVVSCEYAVRQMPAPIA